MERRKEQEYKEHFHFETKKKYWKKVRKSIGKELTHTGQYNIIPSLTLVKVKNGYKPSKYGHCSRFPFCSDMYYIISVLILFALYL